MATIDLSRSGTEFRKHYASVRAQMGRVFVDDDHNDNERLHGEDERRSLVDIIGPAGSPDDGFRIDNATIRNGHIDFDILAGEFYLGGLRLELGPPKAPAPAPPPPPETFQLQADWLQLLGLPLPGPPAPGSKRFDLVYLEAWQQPVSAVEDNELFEVALGGPDSSERIRRMRRVHVHENAQIGDCEQDWQALLNTWAANGKGSLNDQGELVVDTKLAIGFKPGSSDDLCSPPVAGGYLGAENQAIRVQLVDRTHFTWGFDNAAPLYRVQVSNNGAGQPKIITMLTLPKDQAHWPVAGQIIELLPWSAVLDTNNEKLAEQSGFLARVDGSYDPDSKQLTIAASVPAGFGQGWTLRSDAPHLGKPQPFFYLRVWNRGSDAVSPPAIPFVAGNPVDLGQTGLTATFTGKDAHPHDYWIVAARPDSPNRVVPWMLEAGLGGRGPHGVRRFYTPLAVILWDNTTGVLAPSVVHDCRQSFPPLTRIRTCCTYTVGDGVHSFGKFKKIQDAIDKLPLLEGGEVCILPGLYQEQVRIINRNNIIVHGCESNTIVSAGPHPRPQQPVFLIQDSQHITLEDFTIQVPTVPAIRMISTDAAEEQRAGLRVIHIYDLDIVVRDLSAIECHGGRFIRISYNNIELQPLAAPLSGASPAGLAPAIYVQALDVEIQFNVIHADTANRLLTPLGGIQIGGGSERALIWRNVITGGNGNGVSLGSLTFILQHNVRKLSSDYTGAFAGSITGGGHTTVVDDHGCVHVVPDPGNPKDPGGNPMVPVSDGDLYDVRIIANDITNMGANGIATIRFFPREGPLITVIDLEIERNRIRRCVQVDLHGDLIGPSFIAGLGGVALASAEYVSIRGNRIERNGVSFVTPICGIFIALGAAIVIDGNQILNNGPLAATQTPPQAGPRAGIWLDRATTPAIGLDFDFHAMRGGQQGFPAARISDNIVISPMGPALHIAARGAVMVEANQLTTLSLDPQNSVAAGGVPLGLAVWILDAGKPVEFAGLKYDYTNLGLHAYPAGGLSVSDRVAAASYAGGSIGGAVLFNDNQVLLASRPDDAGPILSSVLIVSADDVSMEGNQCVSRAIRQQLFTNAMVFAISARVAGNRFQEVRDPKGLSAFTFALMNSTTDNQGTRCFLIIGIKKVSVGGPNRSLIQLLPTRDPCSELTSLAAKVLARFGLDAL